MHAFVPAVLLGLTGFDALDGDAQAQPPDRELGEVVKPVGAGEWHPVVRADRRGQPALPEQALEAFDYRYFSVDSSASHSSRKREA